MQWLLTVQGKAESSPASASGGDISAISKNMYLESGITPTMLAEANIESESKDLMPNEIGCNVKKPEFYCKVNTASNVILNFSHRRHIE